SRSRCPSSPVVLAPSPVAPVRCLHVVPPFLLWKRVTGNRQRLTGSCQLSDHSAGSQIARVAATKRAPCRKWAVCLTEDAPDDLADRHSGDFCLQPGITGGRTVMSTELESLLLRSGAITPQELARSIELAAARNLSLWDFLVLERQVPEDILADAFSTWLNV